jgi:hypothetical protein
LAKLKIAFRRILKDAQAAGLAERVHVWAAAAQHAKANQAPNTSAMTAGCTGQLVSQVQQFLLTHQLAHATLGVHGVESTEPMSLATELRHHVGWCSASRGQASPILGANGGVLYEPAGDGATGGVTGLAAEEVAETLQDLANEGEALLADLEAFMALPPQPGP